MSDTTQNSNPSPGGGPVVAIILGAVIIIGAIVLVMTAGKRDLGKPQETPESKAPAAEKPAESKPAESKTTQTKPAEPAQTAKPAQPAANADLEVLPLELPNPAFAGTPKQIPTGTKMKPPKDREPYYAPKGLKNVALEKPVTSSDSAPLIGDLDLITDGDKEPLDGRWVELAPGKQWVQIDLVKEHEIHVIMLWHNHMEARVYRDIVVQVSNDPDFVNATTIFNNDFDNTSGFGAGEDYEYFESFEGLLIPVKPPQGLKARYVRCYSKGSTSDEANHYTEVEAWAREAK